MNKSLIHNIIRDTDTCKEYNNNEGDDDDVSFLSRSDFISNIYTPKTQAKTKSTLLTKSTSSNKQTLENVKSSCMNNNYNNNNNKKKNSSHLKNKDNAGIIAQNQRENEKELVEFLDRIFFQNHHRETVKVNLTNKFTMFSEFIAGDSGRKKKYIHMATTLCIVFDEKYRLDNPMTCYRCIGDLISCFPKLNKLLISIPLDVRDKHAALHKSSILDNFWGTDFLYPYLCLDQIALDIRIISWMTGLLEDQDMYITFTRILMQMMKYTSNFTLTLSGAKINIDLYEVLLECLLRHGTYLQSLQISIDANTSSGRINECLFISKLATKLNSKVQLIMSSPITSGEYLHRQSLLQLSNAILREFRYNGFKEMIKYDPVENVIIANINNKTTLMISNNLFQDFASMWCHSLGHFFKINLNDRELNPLKIRLDTPDVHRLIHSLNEVSSNYRYILKSLDSCEIVLNNIHQTGLYNYYANVSAIRDVFFRLQTLTLVFKMPFIDKNSKKSMSVNKKIGLSPHLRNLKICFEIEANSEDVPSFLDTLPICDYDNDNEDSENSEDDDNYENDEDGDDDGNYENKENIEIRESRKSRENNEKITSIEYTKRKCKMECDTNKEESDEENIYDDDENNKLYNKILFDVHYTKNDKVDLNKLVSEAAFLASIYQMHAAMRKCTDFGIYWNETVILTTETTNRIVEIICGEIIDCDDLDRIYYAFMTPLFNLQQLINIVTAMRKNFAIDRVYLEVKPRISGHETQLPIFQSFINAITSLCKKLSEFTLYWNDPTTIVRLTTMLLPNIFQIHTLNNFSYSLKTVTDFTVLEELLYSTILPAISNGPKQYIELHFAKFDNNDDDDTERMSNILNTIGEILDVDLNYVYSISNGLQTLILDRKRIRNGGVIDLS